MRKIPSSQLARAGVVGSAAAKVGAGKIKAKVKRPFLSADANKQEREKQESTEAEILFKAITQLRGTAVKLGQMLGMETGLLPPALVQELRKSYHQVPPLNRVLVSKVITAELGRAPQELFSRFDFNAMAAASLGQAHSALLADGSEAVVKVQYPGIHLTIDSDLKMLRKLAGTAVKLMPREQQPAPGLIEQSLVEVEARLIEETDYLIESANTALFREKLQIDGVSVPLVFDEYSSRRVITTERMNGQHLDEWLLTDPPQSAKNKAAQSIYDVFVESTLKLRSVHADPNPGNYLFRDTGAISLIDFGCVKNLGDRFVDNLPALLSAFMNGSYKDILSSYADLGVTVGTADEADYESILKPFGEWLVLPFQEATFDFGQNADYTATGVQLMNNFRHMPSVETLEEDFIFFDRTLYGLFKIFEKLEAKVAMRHHWEPF